MDSEIRGNLLLFFQNGEIIFANLFSNDVTGILRQALITITCQKIENHLNVIHRCIYTDSCTDLKKQNLVMYSKEI